MATTAVTPGAITGMFRSSAPPKNPILQVVGIKNVVPNAAGEAPKRLVEAEAKKSGAFRSGTTRQDRTHVLAADAMPCLLMPTVWPPVCIMQACT